LPQHGYFDLKKDKCMHLSSRIWATFALLCAFLNAGTGVETTLNVQAVDDRLPTDSLTYQWLVNASPANATGTAAPKFLTSAGTNGERIANPRVVLAVAGRYEFKVTVSDGHLSTTSSAVTVTVQPELLITTQTLADGKVDVIYSQQIDARQIDASSSVTWTISSGTLPAGLSLDRGTGLISGTPKTAGASTCEVTVTNAGRSVKKSFTLRIADLAVNTDPIIRMDERIVVAMNATVEIPITISDAETAANSLVLQVKKVTCLPDNSVVLKAGLLLGGTDGKRSLTVTPAKNLSGTVTIIIDVIDGGGKTASKTFTLIVNAPPVIQTVSATSTTLTLP
jgi:hypothetical protein